MRQVGLISAAAVALLLCNGVMAAPQDHGNSKKQHGKHDKGNGDDQKPVEQSPQQQQQVQQQQQAQAQQLLAAQQQQRIEEQQQRTAAYQKNLDDQLRLAQAQNATLQQQNRRSQAALQEEYQRSLQQQQAQIQSDRNYNYNADPYFTTPSNFRYTREGRRYETNQIGADVLRQAVNNGYQQGVRAGDADHRDHYGFKYRDSFAYRDANYGYNGRYVDQRDYNYYFREGFRKGYDDGYYRRARYGRQRNGKVTILDVVLSGILHLQSSH